jgi:molecular chaperone GrpE (heat shock protein)
MWSWLQQWFGKPVRAEQTVADERVLALEREVQALRLELQERDRVVTNLKGEVERQRGAEETRLAEAVRMQVERLFTDVAAPVVQLLTQTYLLEVEGRPVQAKDVLAVVRRAVRALEDNGFTLEGSVGEAVAFDPNRHEPLRADTSLTPGEQVVVKFVGALYHGKVIKKAGVTKS